MDNGPDYNKCSNRSLLWWGFEFLDWPKNKVYMFQQILMKPLDKLPYTVSWQSSI